MKSYRFLIVLFLIFNGTYFVSSLAKSYDSDGQTINININTGKSGSQNYSSSQNNLYNSNTKVAGKNEYTGNYTSSYRKKSAMPSERFYYPYLDGDIYLKYTGNFLNGKYKDYKGNSGSMTYADVVLNTNINVAKFLSFATKLTFSPTAKRDYSLWVYNNDYFAKEGYIARKGLVSDYGIKAEEIYFNFATDDLSFGAGKFNPSFALGYDNTRYTGIMGTRFTEDYQLKEKIGIFSAITLPFFTFQVNFFTDDTTLLSDSLFVRRNKLCKDVIAGNTGRLNSFSLSSEFVLENDYKINLGLRRLAVEKEDLVPEYAYVFGVERVIEGVTGFDILPFFETSVIRNYRGEKRRNLYYATLNLPFVYENWNFTYTHSLKYDKNDFLYYGNKLNYLAQFNIGYKFESGVMFDISKVFGREYIKTIDGITNLTSVTTTTCTGGTSTVLVADSMRKIREDLDSWNFMISYIYQFR